MGIGIILGKQAKLNDKLIKLVIELQYKT